MSTASMVLLGAGVAASLAGIWALAGLSERSSLRSTPRVLLAAVVGAIGVGLIYQRAPVELRSDLSLALLFGVVGVVGVVVGCAKLDGALAVKNGARALRRASGLVLGMFLSLASIAAVSLELVLRSLTHARFGWSFMLPVAAATLIAFAQRRDLAGAGAKALGSRGQVLAVAGMVALLGARLLVSPPALSAEPSAEPASQPTIVEAPGSGAEPPPAGGAVQDVQEPPATGVAAVPSGGGAASAGGSASAGGGAAPGAAAIASTPPAPVGAPGELQLEIASIRGMLEADARGGVMRRQDRLQACWAEPGNQQSGTLTLKIGIDGAGSVSYSKVIGGDLRDTPLAACLLPVFYKMGFAAPGSGSAHFEITLRTPPR